MDTQKEVSSITIDREVWKQAKAAAALQDRTLADFVEEAIHEALKKSRHEKDPKPRR